MISPILFQEEQNAQGRPCSQMCGPIPLYGFEISATRKLRLTDHRPLADGEVFRMSEVSSE
jgi:hypothetical protein